MPTPIALKIRKAKTDPHPLPGPEIVKDAAAQEARPEAMNLLGIYAALADRPLEAVLAEFAGSEFSRFKDVLADLDGRHGRQDRRARCGGCSGTRTKSTRCSAAAARPRGRSPSRSCARCTTSSASSGPDRPADGTGGREGMQDDYFPEPVPSTRRRLRLPRVSLGLAGRWTGRFLLALIILIALYYSLGALIVHEIDDDPGFAAPADLGTAATGSRAVAIAAALIGREVDDHEWVANDPFFLPGFALDNMPNFQQGIVGALSRFGIEMTDQIGRTRGSSQADADLDKAAGLLKYPGDIWLFDFSTSWAPTASSESQYRAARAALLSYNQRLAAGGAVFERRADNLMATLERIAADLGSASAVIDRHIEEEAGSPLDFEADDIFYRNKGRLYGYYLLLRELGVDFEKVILDRDLAQAWAQMLETFETAATMQPWVVLNGAPSSQFVPSHLAAQGFYLLRARTQLREVTNILLK